MTRGEIFFDMLLFAATRILIAIAVMIVFGMTMWGIITLSGIAGVFATAGTIFVIAILWVLWYEAGRLYDRQQLDKKDDSIKGNEGAWG